MIEEHKNTLSEELFERARKVIPSGVNSPVRAFKKVGGAPFYTESAEGAILKTQDGRELIDFVGTWGPAIHGHNHPKIRAAIEEALVKGTSFGTSSAYEVELAEKVVELVPSIEKVRMVNSGTEATMSAIRVARGYTGRDKIIKFAGCYHGHVDYLLVKAGSGALTFGNPDSAGVPKAYTQDTLVLPFNDFEAIEKTFKEYGSELAAVILEPYIGNCGFILPKEGYLQKLRDLCTEHGTVLIFDEVMTGFRISLGGVQEEEGVIPDMTALGKIIGGGMPVGAFGGKAEIMDCLAPEGPVYQAGTLSGNPLAMAAGLCALKMLEESKPYEQLDNFGKTIKEAVLGAAKEKGIEVQVPQKVSMFSIFFSDKPVWNYEDALGTKTELFNKFFNNALERGVFLPPSPYEAYFVSRAHEGAIADKAAQVLRDSVKAL